MEDTQKPVQNDAIVAGTFGGVDMGLGQHNEGQRESVQGANSYYNNKEASYKATNSITMNNDNVGMMSFNPNPGMMGSAQSSNN